MTACTPLFICSKYPTSTISTLYLLLHLRAALKFWNTFSSICTHLTAKYSTNGPDFLGKSCSSTLLSNWSQWWWPLQVYTTYIHVYSDLWHYYDLELQRVMLHHRVNYCIASITAKGSIEYATSTQSRYYQWHATVMNKSSCENKAFDSVDQTCSTV